MAKQTCMIGRYDVAVIGGGFYGGFIAYQIKQRHPRLSVVLLEREAALFTQASSTNQGQFHRGYIYGQRRKLAAECARNAQLFERHFPDAINWGITAYYGVHRESWISPDSYEAFCASLGLPLIRVDIPDSILSRPSILAAYKTTETTFSSVRLGKLIGQKLDSCGVEVHTSCMVERIEPTEHDSYQLHVNGNRRIYARGVFNVAFAGINRLHRRSGLPLIPTRYDTFVHFFVEVPHFPRDTSLAVIQGDYAIIMPSNLKEGYYVLAAAAYRRLASSIILPLNRTVTDQFILDLCSQALRSCGEYVPLLRDAVYSGHIIGTRAAFQDPRANSYSSSVTFLANFAGYPNYHVLMGGKVSCLFQALQPVLDTLA